MVDLLLSKVCVHAKQLISLSVHRMFMNIIKDRQNNCLTYLPELQVPLNRNKKAVGLGVEEGYSEREEERQEMLCGR